MGSQLTRLASPQGDSSSTDQANRELCRELLGSLPRADQRRKAELYLRGLQTVQGRKTMRNIAAHAGMPAGEQSLHHFISCSTWDWQPVREALAAHLEGALNLRAWVVKPMAIPKSGAHSVGVERRFDEQLGHMVNQQQAFGAWAASERVSVPVNWVLHLPERTTVAECAVRAALDLAGVWTQRPPLPVVLDQVDGAAEVVSERFAAAGVPFLLEIGADTVLAVTDRQWSAGPREPVTAGRAMAMTRMQRRPVRLEEPDGGAEQVGWVAALEVRPGSGGGAGRSRSSARRPLLLVGEWTDARGGPARYWLTNLTTVPHAVLLRLAGLSRRIDSAGVGAADRVGMRDFEGRSFQGWHRHVTLASAAQAASVLAPLDGMRAPTAGRVPAERRRTA